ncbi:MAG: hypothetical protein R3D32_02280 [Nitratireductor sp.]
MFRTLDVVMIAALVAGAAWTFKVKHDSRIALERVAKLEHRLRLEQEAIDILNADWSLLTSPERLEKLAERYREQLDLVPTEPSAIGRIGEIPDRGTVPPVTGEPEKAAAVNNGKDGIKTGSISRETAKGSNSAGEREGAEIE